MWYKLRPAKPAPDGFTAVWILHKLDPERSAVYSVAVPKGEPPGCTCPGHEINRSICNHLMALATLGLIRRPRAARPKKARQPSRKSLRLHDKTARQHLAEIAAESRSVPNTPQARSAARLDAQIRAHGAACLEAARRSTDEQLAAAGISREDLDYPLPLYPDSAAAAAGFRAAVRDHLATMRKGVAS
jgi:hypothetical protein